MQSLSIDPAEQNSSAEDTALTLPPSSPARKGSDSIAAILHTERVYAKPGPIWRMIRDIPEVSGEEYAINRIEHYLTARGIPKEYWINYRQTTLGDCIENARVIPFQLLSETTQETYRDLARTIEETIEQLRDRIAHPNAPRRDEAIGVSVKDCLEEIARSLQSFDAAVRESPKAPSKTSAAIDVPPDPDHYCRYRAAKLFEVLARDLGIFENGEAKTAFTMMHEELLDERFSRFGNAQLPEIFSDLIHQLGERPTPFLRNDRDLYEFFLGGMNDLGPLPSVFSGDDDPPWRAAVIQKIAPLLAEHCGASTSLPTSLDRPVTQSGTRSFVGILKDVEQIPRAVVKIGTGPDRLEEILSETILDQSNHHTVLPFAWGRFGADTFFALYRVAGNQDEDQRFAEAPADPMVRLTFASQLGAIIADHQLSSKEHFGIARPLLAHYRDIAQRVYNLNYDIQVLEKRLESAPFRLQGKVEGVIAAYRHALVFQPTSFATGEVHGDLYPSNIFVEGGDYRIIDNNQAAYYRGRVMSTGDPAKDVGQSIGYLLVQLARCQEGELPDTSSVPNGSLEHLLSQGEALLSKYLQSREEGGRPVTDEPQFMVGAAFHACCFCAKNWTDTKGVKFTSRSGQPPTESMRQALFVALESLLDRVSIPPFARESMALSTFWSRPGS